MPDLRAASSLSMSTATALEKVGEELEIGRLGLCAVLQTSVSSASASATSVSTASVIDAFRPNG